MECVLCTVSVASCKANKDQGQETGVERGWVSRPWNLEYDKAAHFGFKTKGASRINRASQQAPGLSVWNQTSQEASAPSAIIAHVTPNWPDKTTRHTQPTQMLLLHKTTFCRINEGETYTESWGVVEALWKLWEFSSVGGADEHYCIYSPLPELHGLELYPCTLAYLQSHHSALQDTLLVPISAMNIGSKKDLQGITTSTWPPHLETPPWLQLADQTTQHTQRTHVTSTKGHFLKAE